jgi:hypothetical protein
LDRSYDTLSEGVAECDVLFGNDVLGTINRDEDRPGTGFALTSKRYDPLRASQLLQSLFSIDTGEK